jgi:hypothetical protein
MTASRRFERTYTLRCKRQEVKKNRFITSLFWDFFTFEEEGTIRFGNNFGDENCTVSSLVVSGEIER